MSNTRREAINETKMVTLGGVSQYISVKGMNKDNPIMLLLHGGPGAPLSFINSVFPKELAENFVVVHWDQRGAGNSFSEDILSETMNIEQFILDTIELTDYLIGKYKKEKIYILGLSWGSILGINAVHRHPEKFYAYIGTGQMIDIKEGDKIAYNDLLAEVKRQQNNEALTELEEIGKPPYKSMGDVMVFVKWLKTLRFAEKKIDIYKLFMEMCNAEDLDKIVKGASFSNMHLMEEMSQFNVDNIKEINAPVYFCQGKNDIQTPSSLVRDFSKTLVAPKKEFILFEDSGHTAILEEPGKFIHVLSDIFKETYSSS